MGFRWPWAIWGIFLFGLIPYVEIVSAVAAGSLEDEAKENLENNTGFTEPRLASLVELLKKDAETQINRVSKMRKHSRSRYWLPQLKLGVEGDRGSDLTVSAEGDGVSTDVDLDQTWGFSADLSWNLPGIVYNSDFMNAYKEEMRHGLLLKENLILLYELYGERESLRHKRPLSSEQKQELFTVTSRLNVLTNGIYDDYLVRFYGD
jgi:hypothetical protein